MKLIFFFVSIFFISGVGVSSATLSFSPSQTTLDLIQFLDTDIVLNKMNLSENLENSLSRSDAVVLVDRMRVLENSAFEKEMTAYINPFADAPEDADYFPSLMRLAYYQSSSFEASSITKTNELFYPLRHMSREEFVKVALTAFNIPKQSYNLAADFTDSTDMSVWAAKYFETAVYYGIVVGNNGQLLARDKINTREALIILARIQAQFGQNYPFDVNGFEEFVILEPVNSYQKTIGVEYEPAYYKPEATPIKISNITTSYNAEKNYYVLTAVTSDLDIANGATDYYQWHTNAGYFLENPFSPNFKEVHFYPASSMPLSDYVISVSGWDDLGFVSYSGITLSSSVFSYPEDQKAVAESEVGFDAFSALVDSTITATKAVTVDFSATHVTKSNLDLAIDHVVIEMLTGDEEYTLYSDTPKDKKATFIVPEIASLYGKEVTLRAILYIQNVKKQGTVMVQYLPVLMLTGRVYNSGDGPDAEYITIDGQQAYIDEDNRFSIKVDNSSEVTGGSVQVYSGSDANYFQPRTVDLTYQNPRVSMVFIGRNKIIDRDLDGMINEDDAFPDDPTEAYDFDSDGIGNNADTDDDNDGIPDDYEIMHGFNPYDPATAGEDADGDGFNNLEEYNSDTDPLDKDNYPGSINNKSPWILFLPAILGSASDETVPTVTSPATGRVWMDRNLGASRVATSMTDTEAYGSLYQWGRLTDGHEKRNSSTTTTLSSTDDPGHGNFIVNTSEPYDWRTSPNNNLWQGKSGINNPCPNGFRLPTESELQAEVDSWSSKDAAGAFDFVLKLPAAGYRNFESGSLVYEAISGVYWTSTIDESQTDGHNIPGLFFNNSGYADMSSFGHVLGGSVRCIKGGTSICQTTSPPITNGSGFDMEIKATVAPDSENCEEQHAETLTRSANSPKEDSPEFVVGSDITFTTENSGPDTPFFRVNGIGSENASLTLKVTAEITEFVITNGP